MSKRLKSLENDLHCRIYYRSGNSIEFTQEGKIAVSYAQQLDLISRRMLTELNNYTSTIRIGLSEICPVDLIYEMTTSFMLDNPNVSFDIRTYTVEDGLLHISSGDLDFYIADENMLPSKSLTYCCELKNSYSVTMAALIPSGIPTCLPRTVTAEELLDYNAIISSDSNWHPAIKAWFGIDKIPCKNYDTAKESQLITMVNNGIGYAIVPKYYENFISGHLSVKKLMPEVTIKSKVLVAKTSLQKTIVKTFIAFMSNKHEVL